jgi:hypothetical protein
MTLTTACFERIPHSGHPDSGKPLDERSQDGILPEISPSQVGRCGQAEDRTCSPGNMNQALPMRQVCHQQEVLAVGGLDFQDTRVSVDHDRRRYHSSVTYSTPGTALALR